MKYLILITTLLCFTCTSNAQHCEWDNSSLIAVRPLYNGKFVDDLQIKIDYSNILISSIALPEIPFRLPKKLLALMMMLLAICSCSAKVLL